MNKRDAALLAALFDASAEPPKWRSGKSPYAKSLERLRDAGYIRRDGTRVALQNGAKCMLLETASRRYDIATILRHSNEAVFSSLSKPGTNADIAGRTGLSPSTIHRALSEMAAAGMVTRDGKGRIHPAKPLVELAAVMSVERGPARRRANILYRNNTTEIVAVPAGTPYEGQLTAFSMFGEYGVPYESGRDYYAIQDAEMDVNDILIHAVAISALEENPVDMSAAVIFYVSNRQRVDVLRLRSLARSLEMPHVWLDVEAYVRNRTAGNGRLFLPWAEFLEKCHTYGISPEQYEGTGPLFRDMGRRLRRPVTAYLLGGENMRMKGLKASTKDCDILVRSVAEFDAMLEAAAQIGYRRLVAAEYTNDDVRLRPDNILVHPRLPRLDIFTATILGSAVLTGGMARNADYVQCGSLTLGMLCDEHVFLLKAIAGRDGDIHDMLSLVRGPPGAPRGRAFDWETVWKEIMSQEEANPLGCPTETIFDQMGDMSEYGGLEPPIAKRLRLHAANRRILRLVRGGWCALPHVVDMLVGGDVHEKGIRNRVHALLARGMLKRKARGRTVLLCGSERFPLPDLEISGSAIDEYLRWRFPYQRPARLEDAASLAACLLADGYGSVGDVDARVAERLPSLEPPSWTHPPAATDTAKRCMG